MYGPCSSCVHYRVTIGSLHPVERWCVVSGAMLSARDVWHQAAEAHTNKIGVFTSDVPICKFTMDHRGVGEFGEWRASKMVNYYRENTGSYEGFFSASENQYWLDNYYEEAEVELNNSKRFWPNTGDLWRRLQSKKQAAQE